MLNEGQEIAKHKILDFVDDPDARVFNFKGPAGTGKTFTLGDISHALEGQATLCKALGVDKKYTSMEFTATTNKAAKVMRDAINKDAGTIYSRLKIGIMPDFQTGDKKLNFKKAVYEYAPLVVVIDEASYLDVRMYEAIKRMMPECKFIFTQDPYQLQSVRGSKPGIEQEAGEWTAELTEVMRSSGALSDLTTYMRNCVRDEKDPTIDPDDKQIFLLENDDFLDRVDSLFNKDWQLNDARILTFTNNQAQEYNKYLRNLRGQEEVFCSGDFVIVNEFCRGFATDTELMLCNEQDRIERAFGIEYKHFSMGENGLAVPLNLDHFHAVLKQAKDDKDWVKFFEMKEFFVDIRDPYAMTTHKAQGSTYKHSLVDFRDFKSCRNPDTKRRLAYVGVSRASQQFIGCW